MAEDKEKITLNIWGSCATRDIFGCNREDINDVPPPENYQIGSYINGVSLLFACQKGLDIDYDEYISATREVKASNFWKRCYYLALTKKIFGFFERKKCDFLIIDNLFARYTYTEFENGAVCTAIDNRILSCLVDRKLAPKPIRNFGFHEIEKTRLERMVEECAREINNRYSNKQLIINEAFPAEFIINYEIGSIEHYSYGKDNSAFITFKERFEIASTLLRNYLKHDHYIPSPSLMISTPRHRWGKHYLHYLTEYYNDYYLDCINKICLEHRKNNEIFENCRKFEVSTLSKYSIKLAKLKIEDKCKFYYIQTFHNTFFCFNWDTFRLMHYYLDISISLLPIYCIKYGDGMALYINWNGKTLYLKISELKNIDFCTEQICLPIKILAEDKIAICLADDQYLSSEPNGSFSSKSWMKNWETFKLSRI